MSINSFFFGFDFCKNVCGCSYETPSLFSILSETLSLIVTISDLYVHYPVYHGETQATQELLNLILMNCGTFCASALLSSLFKEF